MKVLYKSITANTQVYVGKCFLVGAELTRTTGAATTMIVYDEPDSTVAAAQIVATLNVSPQKQADRIMFPEDKEPQLTGIYVDWTAGVGTVYYHL